jgi:hypothetical protein
VKDSSAFYDTGSVSPNSVTASIFEEDVPSPTLSLCRYFPAAGTMQATRIPVAELLQEALDDRNVHNSGRTRLDLCEAYLTPLAPDARLTLLRRFGPHIAVVLVGDAMYDAQVRPNAALQLFAPRAARERSYEGFGQSDDEKTMLFWRLIFFWLQFSARIACLQTAVAVEFQAYRPPPPPSPNAPQG